MKIVFTGGGTGGHFNPLIAVAQEITALTNKRKLVPPTFFYLADQPYDENSLFENGIKFYHISAGKRRRYASWRNFTDLFRIAIGILQSLWRIYVLFPDVIFSKGGYASFPILVAAKWYKIPVIIHESDSRPGRVNLWSGRFATRVAVSYSQTATFFPPDKTAVTGNPIRRELKYPIKEGAREFLKLEPDAPVVYVTGGSLGAAAINDVILDIIDQLVEKFQIIHQVGASHLLDTQQRASVILEKSPYPYRYKVFDYLNEGALRMVAGCADLIVSRAGSVIFEIAEWGLPAILVPIPEEISHDQRSNAFTYAHTGAAIVIEQKNLSGSIMLSEISRLLADQPLRMEMVAQAKKFARPEAARQIAEAILNLGLEHEE
ncbi:MAG: UDP-N-acetylglucosamine--N-acetylmuramyl-(pentapeptide) pyrophosphoryl-undecaprenol N-acetylglucosamine transferase [Patescibacteria group bacterium]